MDFEERVGRSQPQLTGARLRFVALARGLGRLILSVMFRLARQWSVAEHDGARLVRCICLITEKKADDSMVSWLKGVALAHPASYGPFAEAQTRFTPNNPPMETL